MLTSLMMSQSLVLGRILSVFSLDETGPAPCRPSDYGKSRVPGNSTRSVARGAGSSASGAPIEPIPVPAPVEGPGPLNVYIICGRGSSEAGRRRTTLQGLRHPGGARVPSRARGRVTAVIVITDRDHQARLTSSASRTPGRCEVPRYCRLGQPGTVSDSAAVSPVCN